MARIVLPAKFSQQPQYPTNIATEWENKVAFASVTGINGGRDYVSRTQPVLNGTVNTRTTPKGVSTYTGSLSSGLVWNDLTPIPSIFNTGMSFLLYANPAAAGTQSRAFFLGNESPTPSNQYNQSNIAFNCTKTGTNNSGTFAAFEYNFGFVAAAQSTAGMVDGNWHIFIATRTPGFGTWTLYRDGVDVSDSSKTSGNAIALLPGARVHCHPTGTAGYQGDAVLAVAFNSPLNINQVTELSTNPWQLFKANNKKFWFNTASNDFTLTGVNSTEDNSSSAGSITQVHILTGVNSSESDSSSTGAITQDHVLTGVNSSEANSSSTGAITQEYVLTGVNSSEDNSSSTGSISQVHILTGTNSTEDSSSSVDAITQVHILTGVNSTEDSTSSTGSISTAGDLTGVDSVEDNTSSTGSITQNHVLTGVNSTEDSTSSTGSISQVHILTGAGSTEDSVSSTGSISGGTILEADLTVAGTSSLSLEDLILFNASVNHTGTGTLTANDAYFVSKEVSFSGSSSELLANNSIHVRQVSLTGTGASTLIPVTILTANTNLSGTGAANLSNSYFAQSALNNGGSASQTLSSAYFFNSVINNGGTCTVSFIKDGVPTVIVEADMNSAGSGTLNNIAGSLFNSVINATGTASQTFATAQFRPSSYSMTGTGTTNIIRQYLVLEVNDRFYTKAKNRRFTTIAKARR